MITRIFNLVMSTSLSAIPIYSTTNYINNLSYQNYLGADDPIKLMKERLYALDNNLDIKLKELYNLKGSLNKSTFKGYITEQDTRLLYSKRNYLPSSFDSSPSYQTTQSLDKHSKIVYKVSIKYIPQTLINVHIYTHYVYTTWAGNSWEKMRGWLRASKPDGYIDKKYGDVTINPVHAEINPLHDMCSDSDFIRTNLELSKPSSHIYANITFSCGSKNVSITDIYLKYQLGWIIFDNSKIKATLQYAPEDSWEKIYDKDWAELIKNIATLESNKKELLELKSDFFDKNIYLDPNHFESIAKRINATIANS